MPLLEFEGNLPQVDSAAFVAPTATLIGSVVIEAHASVWYGSVLRGDFAPIIVRSGANIQDGTVLHGAPNYPVEIGEDATIGHNCVIHGAQVGKGALVGNGAVVLDGAKIGARAVVAAGSVVTSGTRIDDEALATGLPAQVKGSIIGTPHELWVSMNAKAYRALAQRHIGVRLLPEEDPGSAGQTATAGPPDGPSPELAGPRVRYLSDEWLAAISDRCNTSQRFRAAAAGCHAGIETEILGAPRGDTAWWAVIDDGTMRTGQGRLPDADLKYSHDWETAVQINKRELRHDEAFFQGRLKVSGDFKLLTGLQPLFQAIDEAVADLPLDF